jgi:hypothetical protein
MGFMVAKVARWRVSLRQHQQAVPRHILSTNDSYSFFSLVNDQQWIILTNKTRIYRAWSQMG